MLNAMSSHKQSEGGSFFRSSTICSLLFLGYLGGKETQALSFRLFYDSPFKEKNGELVLRLLLGSKTSEMALCESSEGILEVS